MLTLSQSLAIAIFILMFIVITIGKVHRYIPAVIGAALTIVFVFLIALRSTEAVVNVLNIGALGQLQFWLPGKEPIPSRGVNWQTIIFILGMMTMIEGLAEAGFFRWLCLYVARLVKCRLVPILLAFMLLSGFLSMFIDSITVMLFLATVTIELARLLKFDPVPVIIAEIFAANIGGAATMSGDPPNIIIGTYLGYTFMDFVVNTGLIAWAGMLVSLGFFYLVFRKRLATSPDSAESLLSVCPYPRTAIARTGHFVINVAIFMLLIVLLVTHAQTGLSVALIGIIVALLTLLVAGRGAGHLVKRIDWRTLLFFLGLFITVGGLEETGVLKMLADYIGGISAGSLPLVLAIILWFSAFASAIVDNIPFAATMCPVILQLSQTYGFNIGPLAWTLALGTDLGGNGTPIGASANVVGTAIAEREGYPVGWGRYMKYALPAMILVVALSHLLLFIRYT